ncbi:hypothetical protein EXIGLDRAFT_700427 [Exidia glandulosa HHB12029]|uniref:Uncharacterized protein n=1 Tax=Exidia glandulosa HHB12029 TaxID=1314781 RepID=A0A165DFP9_EXIGL|nr:hypothetical protein EXIGLDRAFT_700427 [Exidia glandulosa HHB12029]
MASNRKRICWTQCAVLEAVSADQDLVASIAAGTPISCDLQSLAAQYNIELPAEMSDFLAQVGRLKTQAMQPLIKSFGLRRAPAETTAEWTTCVAGHSLQWDGLVRIANARGQCLIDNGCAVLPGAPATACILPDTTTSECYVVQPEQNLAVFGPEDEIQMLVIRHASGSSSSALSDVLEVAIEALNDRNNVRPTHPGKMIQFGQNTGQRNVWVDGCRVFGDVRNISQSKRAAFGEDLVAAKNRRLLGIIGIMWNMVCAAVPDDVMDQLHAVIADAGIPPMHAAGDRGDTGYTVTVNGKEHTFPGGRRPPCEAYISKNYSAPIHTDKTYAPFTLTWNIGRSTHPASTATGGGHFVDCDLGVKVLAATDTLIVFRANHRHGTTLSWGVDQYYLTITFSTRLKAAYDHAQTARNGADLTHRTWHADAFDGNVDTA